jgi:pectinesterase
MYKKSKKVISKLLMLVMFVTTAFTNISNANVFASDISNNRKIDVWDFGGVQAAGDVYNNNITAAILDNSATLQNTSFTTTTFGDLSIGNPDLKDRMYYYESDGTTTGKYNYGTSMWGTAVNQYDSTYTAGGCYYCNGSGGNTRRFLTINNVVAGDKISIYGGTSNGDETIHFVHSAINISSGKVTVTPDSTDVQDTTAAYTINPQRVDFVAKYSGSYQIYVTATKGKPYYQRVVRTPGVQVSGKVNLNGKDISKAISTNNTTGSSIDTGTGYGIKFINQTTNEVKVVNVNSDNTFNANLASGCQYVAVLNGVSNAYKISNQTKLVSIQDYSTSSVQNIGTLDVVDNLLAKINGNIKGIDKNYDISKLKIKLTPPAESLSDTVQATVDLSTMTYSATVEQGLQYAVTVSGVNDYDITTGGNINIKADTAQDIIFTHKTLYTASGKFVNLSSTAKIQSITFTNVDDGYTYAGTVTDNGGYTASLRNGAYSVTAICSENYNTSSHVVINSQNVTKDILFDEVKGWNLVNVTSADITAANYKGLTLNKGTTGGFGVNGNALSAKPGSSIVIPVAKNQRVTVSGWYSGQISFSEDPNNVVVIPSSSTASAPAQISYTAKVDGTVTLNVTGTATAYLTAIDRVQLTDRVADLYVGDNSKQYNYNTVKDALDAAAKMNPTSEDQRITIHIAPGTYRAQLKISTPYITLVNSDPSKEVKITWYYGFGYQYYSAGSDGFYDSDRAIDKYSKYHVSEGKWGGSVYLTSSATAFKAENIVFENSFNKYVTQEELNDGIELCKNFPQSYSGTIRDRKSTTDDVASKVQTERAAAMIIEADRAEFKNCSFIGSQDTLYTGSAGTLRNYFKKCFIEGNTDYIFGDGNSIFDNCTLNFCGYSDQASAGYLTAAKDTATYGYLFRNCTVTANNNNKQTANFFGRPWGIGARVTFMNTKLQSNSIIDPAGWTDMSGRPENAHYAEYNTTYNGSAVDISKRRVAPLNDKTSIADMSSYFGDWNPNYYSKEVTIDYSLTRVTTDGPSSVTAGDSVKFTITRQGRTKLPGTITIIVDGKTLVQGVDYTYDTVQGVVSIKQVTGDMSITIVGKASHSSSSSSSSSSSTNTSNNGSTNTSNTNNSNSNGNNSSTGASTNANTNTNTNTNSSNNGDNSTKPAKPASTLDEAQSLVENAIKAETFFDYNMAYDSIERLPVGNEAVKAGLEAQLTQVSKKVWTQPIIEINKDIDSMVKTKSARAYDELVAKINNADLKSVDRDYLANELATWGKELIWTSDYKAAVEAIVKAWTNMTESNIKSAKEVVSKVILNDNKEYLSNELVKIESKLNKK